MNCSPSLTLRLEAWEEREGTITLPTCGAVPDSHTCASFLTQPKKQTLTEKNHGSLWWGRSHPKEHLTESSTIARSVILCCGLSVPQKRTSILRPRSFKLNWRGQGLNAPEAHKHLIFPLHERDVLTKVSMYVLLLRRLTAYSLFIALERSGCFSE